MTHDATARFRKFCTLIMLANLLLLCLALAGSQRAVALWFTTFPVAFVCAAIQMFRKGNYERRHGG